MRDVTITDKGCTLGAGIALVNGKKVYYTNDLQLLAHAYGEMHDTHTSFKDLIKRYIDTHTKDQVQQILDICEERLKELDSAIPPTSDQPGAKWDGYTIQDNKES